MAQGPPGGSGASGAPASSRTSTHERRRTPPLLEPCAEPQPWMTDEHAAINRAFEPSDLEPLLAAAACSGRCSSRRPPPTSTRTHVRARARHDWIGGVVAWVPLDAPGAGGRALDELPRSRSSGAFVISSTRRTIPTGSSVLRARGHRAPRGRGLVLELPFVFPDHLGDVPELAQRFPGSPSSSTILASRRSGRRRCRWAAQLRVRRLGQRRCQGVGPQHRVPPAPGTPVICSRRSRSRTSASGLTACSAAATGRWRS